MIERVRALYWSPTGATRQLVEHVANAAAAELGCPVEVVDFTPLAARQAEVAFGPNELAVVGAPTYAGKLPNKILPDFQSKLRAAGTPAIAVVTFGNRSFDNSLAELTATLGANGFQVVAGTALVSRHSMSHALGAGRPNEDDLADAAAFASQAARKVAEAQAAGAPVAQPAISGDAAAPYYTPLQEDGTPAKFLKAKPLTDPELCDQCGDCVRLCPMGSIDAADVTSVPGICIKCQACIHGCHAHAKYFDDPQLISHVAALEKTEAAPKENAFFLD